MGQEKKKDPQGEAQAEATETNIAPETSTEPTPVASKSPEASGKQEGPETPGAVGTGEDPNPECTASDDAETAAAEKSAAETKATKKSGPATTPAQRVENALTKAGRSILERNPALTAVYMTADGAGFASKNDAENHARNLKNKVVTPVNR